MAPSSQRLEPPQFPGRFNIFNQISQRDTMEKTLLFKADSWAYEQEWRLIRTENEPGIRLFSPTALIGVIFGCGVQESDKKKVMDWVRQRNAPLMLWQAKIHDHAYKLTFSKC